MSKLSDPRIIGPGVWYSIHLMARNATTLDKKEDFIDYMEDLAESFPCMNCRKHIQAYLADNPFEPFMDMYNDKGEDIGMFKWSWMFHNTVNARLAKPIMDWNTAWHLYEQDSDMICSQDCGEDSHTNSEEILSNEDIVFHDDFDPNLNINDYQEQKRLPQRSINVTSISSSNDIMNDDRLSDKKTLIQGYFLTKGISHVLHHHQ